MRETLCCVCRQGVDSLDFAGEQPLCSRWCQIRRNNLYRLYGLLPDDFWDMWERQGGICAMPGCETALKWEATRAQRNQGAEIDHDHVTGRVRGLLCPKCNKALGGYEALIPLGVADYLASSVGIL